MPGFNIENNTKIRLEKDRCSYIVHVEQYSVVVEDIGSVSSSGDCFEIYPHDLKHCGYHRFGLRLDDFCPACDENQRRRVILKAAHFHAMRHFSPRG